MSKIILNQKMEVVNKLQFRSMKKDKVDKGFELLYDNLSYRR